MTAQFPPRLLLAGAVVTALTASGGTVLTFPSAMIGGPASVPMASSGSAAAAASAASAASAAPVAPPTATGADIAALASGSAGAVAGVPAEPAPRAASGRSGTSTAPSPDPDPDREGLSESDWARLPISLRQRVRLACDQGYLSGPHCAHA
ncbi:hypothetical protein [Pseudonocardia sp.]|uniref:hypothetical protein n=1 Tax=Pseudonocardia sp. TaxID=60912 RepID=UPI003D0BD890